LEARVAYQWELPPDSLGSRHAHHRDQVVLGWLADAVRGRGGAVLDVGCAYGNHLLMLNAYLGKDSGVELQGVDLYDKSLGFAQSFADVVPGYANCRFSRANISEGLPFADGSFDAVNLADVLEHLVTPDAALREIRRVLRPGGTLVISTPLKGGLFKRGARAFNRLTRGKLYRVYYRGKETHLDERGEPVMHTRAGLDHVSEMDYDELIRVGTGAGFSVDGVEVMSVMSGSAWFDRHPLLLAMLLVVESLHLRLRYPSWGHSVCLRLTAR
jgi:SAM-dependent methyltransferase